MVNSLRELSRMTDNTQPTRSPEPPDGFDDLNLIRGAALLNKMWNLDPNFEPVPNRDSAQAPPNHQTNQQGEDLQMLPEEERHQRKCAVCQHPDRAEIEEEFIHWGRVYQLAKQYDIADYRSIHRHARVFGLVARRRENTRGVLDQILERGPEMVTVAGVIQAIKAYSCLTDDNRWVELPHPPRRIEYHISTDRTPNPAPEKAPIDVKEIAPAATKAPAETPEPEPEVIVDAGAPPGPLPAWNGRFSSNWGNPRR